MVHDDWMMTEGMPRAYDLGKPQLLLVGGFNPSEKYWSMGRIIPYILENNTCSKPPTRLGLLITINHY